MSSWQRSGGLLFEKVDVRELSIGITSRSSLDEDDPVHVALARFGGPIATFDAKTRLVQVFAGGGKFLGSCIFNEKLCLHGGFGWTENLILTFICGDDEGSVFIWDDFQFPQQAQQQNGLRKLKIKFGQPIKMCSLWNNNIVALTNKFTVLVMKNLRSSPSLKWAAVSFPLVSLPRALVVLRPYGVFPDSQLEIAVALPDQAGMLVACPEKKSVDARVPQFRALPSRFLVPHPTETIVASLDVNDRLLVVNHTWEEILYARDCDLGSDFVLPPASLAWCLGGPGYCLAILWPETPWSTSSSTAVSFNRIVENGKEGEEEMLRFTDSKLDAALKYGPGMLVLGFPSTSNNSASTSRLPVDSPNIPPSPSSAIVARFAFPQSVANSQTSTVPRIFIISEIDGLRIIINQKMSFLRRVSKATQTVEAIGSIAPSALLLDSLQQEHENGATHSLTSSMEEEDLISAVDDLLEASKFEFDFEKKLLLLRASLVGKDKIQHRVEDKARLSKKFHAFCEFYRGTQYLWENGLTTASTLEISRLGSFRFLARLAYLGFTKEAKAVASVLSLKTTGSGGKSPLERYSQAAFCLLEARLALRQNQATTISSLAKILFNPHIDGEEDRHQSSGGNSGAGGNFVFHRCEGAPSALSLSCLQEKEFSIKLCDYESNITKKIITLLALGEHDRVLKLMEMSSNTLDFDLKARAIMYCMGKQSHNIQEDGGGESKFLSHPIYEPIIRAIYRSNRNAVKLERWLLLCSSNKFVTMEKRLRASCDRAFLLLETCLFTSDMQLPMAKKLVFLQEVTKEFDLGQKQFFAQQVREFLQLMQIQQKELNVLNPLLFTSQQGSTRSLASTIVDCVSKGKDDLADKLRKQFHMKPLLFWKCKLKGFAKRNMLFEFYKLCSTDKEAGKYVKLQEILEICFDYGQDSSASKIAFDLPENHPEKPRTFVKLRMWPEALKFSQTSRCLDSTQDIITKCRDLQIVAKANVLFDELKALLAASGPNQFSQVDEFGDNAGNTASGFLGLVTGAVNQPQRCQQQ
jgi:hypothetical protein